MPTNQDTSDFGERGRQSSVSGDARVASPSSTGQTRRTRPSDTGSTRRVRREDAQGKRRVATQDTGRRKKSSSSDATGQRRALSQDTGSMKRTGQDTGSMKRAGQGTGSMKRVGQGTGSMKRSGGEPQRRRRSQRPASSQDTGRLYSSPPSDTGSVRIVSDTGQFTRPPASDTGYVDASLDGTTASIDTRKRRVKQRASRSRANRAVPMRTPTRGAHAVQSRQKTPIVAVLLVLVLVVGIGAVGFFIVNSFMHPFEGADVPDGQTVTVQIPDGCSGTQIIDILLDSGVIHSSADFRKAVKNQNADQSLRSGSYTFVTGSDPSAVVRQLVQGPNSDEGHLTVPEGLTITQTAALVESVLGIDQHEFLVQAKASNYASDYSFVAEAADDSLEGFLYPKTYDFAGRDVSADSVIRLMLDQFQTEMEGLDLAGARQGLFDRYGLNVTDYDIIKIASIIEKEAISEDDRPKVSSVFYNRLSDGMALQSDATMGYVTGGAVSSEDLAQDSPYNTYFYKGLPPTPICTPSLWAIEAAMYPADTDYLFFFIIETDSYSNHTFSKTFEEHNSAYIAALAEQERASSSAEDASEEV